MNVVHITCEEEDRDRIRGICWEILKRHRPEYRDMGYSDRLMIKKIVKFYIENDTEASKWI